MSCCLSKQSWFLADFLPHFMLCPNFRQHGVCNVEDCPHFHPNLVCDLCGVICRSQAFFNNHLNSFRHQSMKKASSRNPEDGPKKCRACNVSLGSPRDISAHFNSQKHRTKIESLRQAGTIIRDEDMIVNDDERNYDCLVCEIRVWEPQPVHQRSARHRRRERFLTIRAALEEAEKDKNGISVEPSGKDAFDFGLSTTGRASREIRLSLDSSQSRVVLRSATLSGSVKKQSW